MTELYNDANFKDNQGILNSKVIVTSRAQNNGRISKELLLEANLALAIENYTTGDEKEVFKAKRGQLYKENTATKAAQLLYDVTYNPELPDHIAGQINDLWGDSFEKKSLGNLDPIQIKTIDKAYEAVKDTHESPYKPLFQAGKVVDHKHFLDLYERNKSYLPKEQFDRCLDYGMDSEPVKRLDSFAWGASQPVDSSMEGFDSLSPQYQAELLAYDPQRDAPGLIQQYIDSQPTIKSIKYGERFSSNPPWLHVPEVRAYNPDPLSAYRDDSGKLNENRFFNDLFQPTGNSSELYQAPFHGVENKLDTLKPKISFTDSIKQEEEEKALFNSLFHF